MEQIVALVEGMRDRTRVLAVLDTLEFIYRGGRVSWVAALIGTLMRIKPIIEVRKGEIKLLERARTLKHSLARLMDLVQALGPLERAIVLHANTPETADQVADFTDIRELRDRLVEAGIEMTTDLDPESTGPASIAFVDPDGNPVLIDQFFDKPG